MIRDMLADAALLVAAALIAVALFMVWTASTERRALVDLVFGGFGFVLLGLGLFLVLRVLS